MFWWPWKNSNYKDCKLELSKLRYRKDVCQLYRFIGLRDTIQRFVLRNKALQLARASYNPIGGTNERCIAAKSVKILQRKVLTM